MTSPRPRELITPEARAVREALAALPDTADPAALAALREAFAGVEPEVISGMATQARLARRAQGRLGAWADDMVLDEEALQQATRRDVARYRAAQLVQRLSGEMDAPGFSIADLGCGLGVDSRAFAEAGCQVIAVERDPWRAEAAEINLRAFGERAQVIALDAMDLPASALASCAAAYVDPARRESGGPRRIDGGRSRAVAAPEEWSPPWPWVVTLARRMPVIAKVAPGFDARLAPSDADIEWIDHEGETVEACVWMGSLGRGMRRATALAGDRSESLEAWRLTPPDAGPSTSQVGAFLIEPTPAAMRADLIADLAGALGAKRLDGGAWLTADSAPQSLLARAWGVMEEVPHQPRDLRAWLRGRGAVTWKTSDTRASAPEWDRRVGHRPARGGTPITIIITGHGRAFAVDRSRTP